MTPAQEAKERLRAAARLMASVESVGAMVSVADLDLIVASHDALEESVARLSRERQPRIDAARLEGIREGRDAAFRVLITRFLSQERGPPEWHTLGTAISTLDPETVAKEAGQ